MFPLLGCARVDNICFDQKLILTYKKAETLRTFGLFSGPARNGACSFGQFPYARYTGVTPAGAYGGQPGLGVVCVPWVRCSGVAHLLGWARRNQGVQTLSACCAVVASPLAFLRAPVAAGKSDLAGRSILRFFRAGSRQQIVNQGSGISQPVA